MILQRIFRIIVGDAGFESGTTAQEVWCTTKEPTYLLQEVPVSNKPAPVPMHGAAFSRSPTVVLGSIR